jgi:uncharacterized protein
MVRGLVFHQISEVDPGSSFRAAAAAMLPPFRLLWARAVVTLLLTLVACAAHALTFPELTGRVVEDAGILDSAAKAALESKLAEFEISTTGQLVVVTLKSLQGTSIEDYGYQLGRHWGIGQREKSTGALLIVAPHERKVRIEVGYGFEGTLTDAASRLIIENSILPRFRTNDFAGGINRGVDEILQAVSVDSEESKQRASQPSDDQLDLAVALTLLLFLVIICIIVSRIAERGRPQVQADPLSGSRSTYWWDCGGSFFDAGSFAGGGGSFGGGGASGSW